MGKRRIQVEDVQKLVAEGITSAAEIAKRLGANRSTTWRIMRDLGLARASDLALQEASKFHRRQLDAVAQLARINEAIEKELIWVQKELRDKEGDDRRLLQQDQIRHTAELRKQLSLALDIYRQIDFAREFEVFKEIVLVELGVCSDELRDRVIARLRERRLSGQALGGAGSQFGI